MAQTLMCLSKALRYLIIALLIGGAASNLSGCASQQRITDTSGNPISDVYVVGRWVRYGGAMGHARVDCVGFELAKSGQDGSFVLPSNPIGTDPTIHFYKKGLERNFAW